MLNVDIGLEWKYELYLSSFMTISRGCFVWIIGMLHMKPVSMFFRANVILSVSTRIVCGGLTALLVIDKVINKAGPS